MIALPAARIRVGATDLSPFERPVREVAVAAFDIDRTEVTVGSFSACVDAGVCTPPVRSGGSSARCSWSRRKAHPDLAVNCVTHQSAANFCAHVGKRLPSEYEWEYAARGTDFRKYPWGNEDPNVGEFCVARGGPVPCQVATTPQDESPFGVLDLAGNVREWTSSSRDLNQGRLVYEGALPFVVKGEGWFERHLVPHHGSRASSVDYQLRRFRTAYRGRGSAGTQVGFRCAR